MHIEEENGDYGGSETFWDDLSKDIYWKEGVKWQRLRWILRDNLITCD